LADCEKAPLAKRPAARRSLPTQSVSEIEGVTEFPVAVFVTHSDATLR